MAYVPSQDNTQNKSLTSDELLPTLVASSPFLMYQKGVSGNVLKGETIPIAQLAGALEDYTGADLVGDSTADAGGVITMNSSKGWWRLIKNADQDRSAIGGLAQKYGDMYNRKMAAAIDTTMAAKGATTTNTAGLETITAANAEDVLTASISNLVASGVDRADINSYVPSWYYNLLARLQGRNIDVTNSAIVNGVVLPFLGTKVHECNNLAAGSTTGDFAIVTADWALQYGIGSMVSTVEPTTGSKNFGEASKGYTVWGDEMLDVTACRKIDVVEG